MGMSSLLFVEGIGVGVCAYSAYGGTSSSPVEVRMLEDGVGGVEEREGACCVDTRQLVVGAERLVGGVENAVASGLWIESYGRASHGS
jgi:hypothetical protein